MSEISYLSAGAEKIFLPKKKTLLATRDFGADAPHSAVLRSPPSALRWAVALSASPSASCPAPGPRLRLRPSGAGRSVRCPHVGSRWPCCLLEHALLRN